MTFASGARSGAGSAAFGWLLPAHLRPLLSKNMVLHIGTGASRRSFFSSHGEFPAESKVTSVKTHDTVKIVMTLHLRKHAGFLFFFDRLGRAQGPARITARAVSKFSRMQPDWFVRFEFFAGVETAWFSAASCRPVTLFSGTILRF